MSKTLIILTFAMLFFGSAFELINPEKFELIDSKTQAGQIDSTATNMEMLLRKGMGIMEVEVDFFLYFDWGGISRATSAAFNINA